MQPSLLVTAVFGRFHNLNLIALVDDLRQGRTIRGRWSLDSSLCPVSHGMEDGDMVKQLDATSQGLNLQAACRYASRHLRIPPRAIQEFVGQWDSSSIDSCQLLSELEQLWADRLADADAVQEILERIDPPNPPLERGGLDTHRYFYGCASEAKGAHASVG